MFLIKKLLICLVVLMPTLHYPCDDPDIEIIDFPADITVDAYDPLNSDYTTTKYAFSIKNHLDETCKIFATADYGGETFTPRLAKFGAETVRYYLNSKEALVIDYTLVLLNANGNNSKQGFVVQDGDNYKISIPAETERDYAFYFTVDKNQNARANENYQDEVTFRFYEGAANSAEPILENGDHLTKTVEVSIVAVPVLEASFVTTSIDFGELEKDEEQDLAFKVVANTDYRIKMYSEYGGDLVNTAVADYASNNKARISYRIFDGETQIAKLKLLKKRKIIDVSNPGIDITNGSTYTGYSIKIVNNTANKLAGNYKDTIYIEIVSL